VHCAKNSWKYQLTADSSERGFSELKLVNSYLRFTTSQEPLTEQATEKSKVKTVGRWIPRQQSKAKLSRYHHAGDKGERE
jgi:hypothetical protein